MYKRLPGFAIPVLVVALVAWGCGTSQEPPAEAPPAGPATAPSAEIEPPSGGDIIVDGGGYKLDQNGAQTDISYSQSTDLWIPTGFTGEITQMVLSTSAGQVILPNTIELSFPSNAQFKITAGNPATWECRASSSASWSACATRAGTEISSQYKVQDGSNNASIQAGPTNYPFGANVSLTIK